jgi:hypothetical protein
MANWIALGIVTEGSRVELNGVNLWDLNWKNTGQDVDLPHPQYLNQIHSFRICEGIYAKKIIRFAVAEVSNAVYAFYRPKP